MEGKPEGWYTDPENPKWNRWWNGEEWTDNAELRPRSAEPVTEDGEVHVDDLPIEEVLFWAGAVASVIVPILGIALAAGYFAFNKPSRAGAFVMASILGVMIWLALFPGEDFTLIIFQST